MQISLLTAREIPNGYTWTLTSRLGDMLSMAEAIFGIRDKNYTVLGIEFNDSGPRIWYPKNNGNIIVQLTPEALNSETIAFYQLAHECVHLLSPSGGAHANVLEEGVAVWFSWYYLRKVLQVDGKPMTDEPNYLTAGLLVEKLFNINPNFFKTVREICPRIWELKTEQLKNICPELIDEEAWLLTLPFKQGNISKARYDYALEKSQGQ